MWEGFGMNVAHPLEKQCGWWSRETSYALTESESRKPYPIFEADKGCDGGEIGELDSQVLLWHLTVSLQPSILHPRARRAASQALTHINGEGESSCTKAVTLDRKADQHEKK